MKLLAEAQRAKLIDNGPRQATVSLEELAAVRGLFGLGIERDLHFEARAPISVYIKAGSKAGIIVENVMQDEGGAP